jgi:hypothetical protein
MTQEMGRDGIPVEFRAFVDRAMRRTLDLGAGAALLLVGSRGAGYHDDTSDLDLWIVGDRERLTPDEAREYDSTGQVFVDRGDYEAHWTFYDAADLAGQFQAGHDERLWTFLNSRAIAGDDTRVAAMRCKFARYPPPVAEAKLRWLMGRVLAIKGSLRHARRGDPATTVAVAAEIAQCLWKMCCLAERRPFPYSKWLARAATEMRMGRSLCPRIDRAMTHVGEVVARPDVTTHREWTPVRELEACIELAPSILRDLGWDEEWLDSPTPAIAAAMAGAMP